MHSAAYYSGRLRSLRGFRARIELPSPAPQVEATRDFSCTVTLTNVGHRRWRRDGWHPVHLSYHWRQGAHAFEGRRFALPADLHPGDTAQVPCTITAPAAQGEYVLEFDLVRELVGWFHVGGSAPLRVPLTLHDYDYQTTYQTADLDRDYWTVVGPTSREEYEFLGRFKRQTLIDLGMTEHVRLLDVGCGTGQLAEALQDFIADDGMYFGTDISAAAVAFCRKKFLRPNFLFRKNEMTAVDADHHLFDIIFLGSVFTHMYPDEIRAMLIDLRRSLASGGLIVADALVSPDVAVFAGNRSRVEINEAHLMQVFRETGLDYRVQGATALPGGGRRLGCVFSTPAPEHPGT